MSEKSAKGARNARRLADEAASPRYIEWRADRAAYGRNPERFVKDKGKRPDAFIYNRNEAWVTTSVPNHLYEVPGWGWRPVLGARFVLFEREVDYPTARGVTDDGIAFDRSHVFTDGEIGLRWIPRAGTLRGASPRKNTIPAGHGLMVSNPMGGPYDTDTALSPCPAAVACSPGARPPLPGLGQAQDLALKAGNRAEPSLTVSLDSEFLSADGEEGEKRSRARRAVTSWQVCFETDGRLVEWVLIPATPDVLDIDELCGMVAERAGAERHRYADWTGTFQSGRRKGEKRTPMDAPAFDMTLVCHAAQADVTTLKGSKRLLQMLSDAAGGLFTGRKTWESTIARKKVVDGAGNSQFYRLRVRVRDTMNFAAAGTSLAEVGRAVGLPKLEMSEEDYRDMARVRGCETARYLEYAIRDVEIVHRYLAAAFGMLNVPYKPTIPSLSAVYLRTRCTQQLVALGYDEKVYSEGSDTTTDVYDFVYRGLRSVNVQLVEMHDSRNFVMDQSLEPVSEWARDAQDLAARSYRGGWNGSTIIGYYDVRTYDPDLCGAYPTASGAMLDPDWEKPFVRTWENEDMTLQQLPPWSAFRPGFGCVHFEFPPSVKYPCLGTQTDHGIVFTRTSESTSGCYVTLPEIVLALRLGAKIHAIRFVIPAVHERDGLLLRAYKDLIEQRERDAAAFGKKSVQALGDKLMNNAGYGKHGQDVSPKEVRCLWNLEMEDRGTCQITNPVVAAMSTALPRVCLLAAANQLHALGHNVYSVTTDGFITDAPMDVLQPLDLYGFAGRMRYVRSYFTDGRNDAIWELKHEQQELLNCTTRLNIGFCDGGVLARGGYKGYKPDETKKVSRERREQFAHDIATRKGPLSYVSNDWVSPADMLKYDEDMHITPSRHAANPNFDFKRLPDLDTMRDVEFACAGDVVRVANFDTRPYETLPDFRRHKKTVGQHQLVVTEDFVRAAERAANYTGRELTDSEFARWAVVAHRSGRLVIPALDALWGSGRLRFINHFIHEGRPFGANDWKNAGRQARQNLPEERVWKPFAEEMASVSLEDAEVIAHPEDEAAIRARWAGVRAEDAEAIWFEVLDDMRRLAMAEYRSWLSDAYGEAAA